MIPGRVSIVIPCYNQEEYLTDAIKSAEGQTHEDIEIVVVDDGSVPPLNKNNYPQWIDIIPQANKGLPAARNAGIQVASGEWILPLDADDKIHPDFITKALATAAQHNADIISTGLQFFGTKVGKLMPEPAPTHRDFLRKNRINCCSLFRKAMWVKLGGYDERMRDGFEDWYFWLCATAAGYTVRVVQEPLFYYRRHGPSLINHARANREKIVTYMRTKFPNLEQV